MGGGRVDEEEVLRGQEGEIEGDKGREEVREI